MLALILIKVVDKFQSTIGHTAISRYQFQKSTLLKKVQPTCQLSLKKLANNKNPYSLLFCFSYVSKTSIK